MNVGQKIIIIMGMTLQVYGTYSYGNHSCEQRTVIIKSSQTTISLREDSAFRGPLELGFNLESVPFERTFWAPNKGNVLIDIRRQLAAMPGVVLRYPGGSTTNRFDYSGAMGEKRSIQSLVNWAKPSPVLFGPTEFVKFTHKIDGQVWLVMNVLGDEKKHLDPKLLARSNVNILKKILQTTPILGIELGNELYMPRHNISGSDYFQRLVPTIKLLKNEIPNLRIVVGLAGYDIGKMRATDFNHDVINGLKSTDVEFSIHYYYDGPPGGPPIKSALRDLCKTIKTLRRTGYDSPKIWLTEHGRWPGGRVSDPGWNKLWPNTYNLGAALSVAEFTIAAAQIPEVQGLFLHSMSGSRGPWTMFHPAADDSDTVPSVTYLTQTLLHELSQGEILATSVSAPVYKSTPEIRAVFVGNDSKKIRLLIVHRGKESQTVNIELPRFRNKNVNYVMESLTGNTANSHNALPDLNKVNKEKYKSILSFSNDGKAKVKIPKLSVVLVTFSTLTNDN